MLPARRKGRSAGICDFSIVGIGASAGGLEALEAFFQAVPVDCGMAFVLVQHLDPSHTSMLAGILQRNTRMTVVEAEDNMSVSPNRVYVIPPNREMVIVNGNLQLSVPDQPSGHRMPVDAFLRSLAEEQGDCAIGIVLSGTGTDGTQGLRAIRDGGGLTIAQEPETAKYDGMPSSAIHAGYVSLVLPVDKMPAALLKDKRMQALPQENGGHGEGNGSLNRILQALRNGTGNDFSKYKRSTIARRIQRRMLLQNIEDMDIYARYLRGNPEEVQLLFKELLINVTSFFRDPEAFAMLRQEFLPNLLANREAEEVFRVWVAGCASGEEAYSIAILLREILEDGPNIFKAQIYATDLDFEAIVAARSGRYTASIARDMTPERLQRFFDKIEDGYQVKKEIREMVVFATQNVIKDPPFTKMDLISCRNLLIYIEPELQDHILGLFHYSLKPGGILLLSPSESTGSLAEMFDTLSLKWKIHRSRVTRGSEYPPITFGRSYGRQRELPEPQGIVNQVKAQSLSNLMQQTLLESYAPASVLTDFKGNILYVHGETGKYFRPAPGIAAFNALEMARNGLQPELGNALHKAAIDGTPTLQRKLSVQTNGSFQNIALSVRPVAGGAEGEGVLLVSFQELPRAATRRARGKLANGEADPVQVEELKQELAETKENLQAIIEEQQASNEELKSTNEELQSTNEELQSTNEELETSKEELQSVNEELITVNSELQAKIEQLNNMQNDMKNLLDNTSIGTIFLDDKLTIRRFTQEASKVYRLVGTDIGRPLEDIKSDIEGEDLLSQAKTVLDTLVPCEHEVRTENGISYLVRIRPYRTFDNVIEGVVLTFTDITSRIRLEKGVNEARRLAEAIVDTVRDPLLVLDANLRVVSASRSFCQFFKVAAQDTVGRPINELAHLQWRLPKLRELLEGVLANDVALEGYRIEHDLSGDGKQTMLLNARRIVSDDQTTNLLLVAIETPAKTS